MKRQGTQAQAKQALWLSTAAMLLVLPTGAALAQNLRDLVPNQTSNAAMINLILQMVKQGNITPQNGTILIQEALGGTGGTPVLPPPPYQQQAPRPLAQASAPTADGKKALTPARTRPAPAQVAPQQVAQAAPPVYAPPLVEEAPPAPAPARVTPPAPAPQQVAQTQLPSPAPPVAATPVAPPPAPVPAAPPPPTIRVSYVPESVRKQIAEEVRTEVMAKAKAEGWAAPGDASPDWVRRITLSGDLRFRSQSELFARSNANDILDYTAFNNVAGGSDVTNVQNLTFLNTTEDRLNRARIRARLGLTANVSKQVEIGIRLATGDDNSPISTNQNLAGGLAKREIWLDRGYLKLKPTDWVDVTLGRFANPFRSSDILFDDDLNFDGVTWELRGDRFLAPDVKVALRGGAFPLDFGSSNFPNTETTKRKYPSKWLLSAQLEASFKPTEDVTVSGAVGYHDFHNVQGKLSDPCPFNGINDKNDAGNGTVAADPVECSTDGRRAFQPRKGNTLFFIRNLQTTDVNGVALERQYLGLTYKYRVLDLHLGIDTALNDSGVHATLSGNYLRNIGFKHSDECRYGTLIGPFTNVKVTSGLGNACNGEGVIQSGNEGWLANFAVGHARPRHWGEWRAEAGYRYLQSDATLDSLTDSDFHLGGTNAKGYTVGGTIGLFDGLALAGKWLSANEITGRPLSIDVLQFDLLAEF